MRLDLVHRAVEKVTLVLERARRRQLDQPLTVLPDQALEIVAIAKKIMMGRAGRSAYRLDHDRDGRGGLRSDDEVTMSRWLHATACTGATVLRPMMSNTERSLLHRKRKVPSMRHRSRSIVCWMRKPSALRAAATVHSVAVGIMSYHAA
jgi:hypothetical protein